MQHITDLIEQNTASARSARQAANELLATSHELEQLISSFELYPQVSAAALRIGEAAASFLFAGFRCSPDFSRLLALPFSPSLHAQADGLPPAVLQALKAAQIPAASVAVVVQPVDVARPGRP